MLLSLNIRNVVLIDKLQLDFANGLSVFTGETGAGKSILLDSLALTLGERAESSLVRNGEKSLQVISVFDISNNEAAKTILRGFEIDADDELFLKRTVTADGKSRAYVNDVPVTVNALKQLAGVLVEIHGQFMTHGLLDNKTHIEVLDEYGGYDLSPVRRAFAAYCDAKKEYDTAIADFDRLKADEDYLKHNWEELKNFKIKDGEYSELAEKIALAANAEKIYQSVNTAYSCLNSNDVIHAVRAAHNALSRIDSSVTGKYEKYIETLDRLEIDLKEITMDLSGELCDLDINPADIDMMQERFFAFKALAKKHGVEPEDLPTVLDKLQKQIDKIDLGNDYIVSLERKVENARLDYMTKAREISEKRKRAAAALDKSVMGEFPDLKLNGAKFKTEIVAGGDMKENGIDTVRFKVITNAGGVFEDLAKTASGGELSRFMLALKVNLVGGCDTIIFDEVDAGIGGATANAVGSRLQSLGANKQVLVVTHSPQVASFGSSHFKVKKFTKDMNTYTTVDILSADERIDEIARMLSGKSITEASRKAAKQMVEDNERA